MATESNKKQGKLETIISLPLPDKQLQDLIIVAKDWAVMHGVGMRPKTNFSQDSLNFAPFILFPSPFPRREFDKAIEMQIILNELMHKVAHDQSFLSSSLQETILVDDFTGKLFKIYETIQNEGIAQKVILGLVRSDYMVHTLASNSLKQVEFNTIASSFGGISTQMTNLHRFILEKIGLFDKLKDLPENQALKGLCEGMVEAWKIYGKSEAVILFVVEDVTYNICDQRFHEFEIQNVNKNARVIRRTLTQISQKGKLSENNELIIEDHLVAVVYYRAGYEPGHYHSQKEWDARLLIERSQAIKCPSIQYHLAGTKKVQQALAKTGALEMFLNDKKKIEEVRGVFTGLYSLDFDELGDQAVQMAIENPERYVLKPQREGGGNNVYGKEIKDAVLKIKENKERAGWILMDRIQPPIVHGYAIRPGDSRIPKVSDLVSELGIFGVVVGDSKNIIINRQVGHMLRTKSATENEGGVAAGAGALDSPYLVD